jgi:hypothetical protein
MKCNFAQVVWCVVLVGILVVYGSYVSTTAHGLLGAAPAVGTSAANSDEALTGQPGYGGFFTNSTVAAASMP